MASPLKGAGIGLRPQHFQHILEHQPQVAWFEALTDNYMLQGGPAHHHLDQIRSLYPLAFHGVGLSLGSTNDLDSHYIQQLKTLLKRYEPTHISDHIAWSAIGQHHLNDLLPLPFTQATISQVVQHIQQVQEALGERILVENISTYLQFQPAEMPEWAFVQNIVDQSGCLLLLDVNNIYVNSQNHGFDPETYLNAIRPESVGEIHLAGFTACDGYLSDTHGEKIHAPVWQLYQKALQRFGAAPTLIEWDTDIPHFDILQQEALQAQTFMDQHATESVTTCL